MRVLCLFGLLVSLMSIHSFADEMKDPDNTDKKKKVVLFLGDSLTEGYGVKKEEAYPFLVGEKIKKELNKNVEIINGGISGSTTASGLSRLKWYLKMKRPDVMLLALGANDGLRGVSLEDSKKNLEKTIKLAQENKVKVLLGGMMMPPNYGPEYTKKFKGIFTDLQKEYGLKAIPFILKDVARKKELNQDDGIHPNPNGHQVVAETVFQHLKDML